MIWLKRSNIFLVEKCVPEELIGPLIPKNFSPKTSALNCKFWGHEIEFPRRPAAWKRSDSPVFLRGVRHGQQDHGRPPKRTYRRELDLETRVWSRARVFPRSRLDSRLKCPRRGSRKVAIKFESPTSYPLNTSYCASIMQRKHQRFQHAERENSAQSDIPLR
jgi:hypothetical protein